MAFDVLGIHVSFRQTVSVIGERKQIGISPMMEKGPLKQLILLTSSNRIWPWTTKKAKWSINTKFIEEYCKNMYELFKYFPLKKTLNNIDCIGSERIVH